MKRKKNDNKTERNITWPKKKKQQQHQQHEHHIHKAKAVNVRQHHSFNTHTRSSTAIRLIHCTRTHTQTRTHIETYTNNIQIQTVSVRSSFYGKFIYRLVLVRQSSMYTHLDFESQRS